MIRAVSILGLVLVGSVLVAAEPPPPVGTKVAEFTATDAATGKPWGFADHTRAAKASVVLFLGTGCPVSNAYLPKLAMLHGRYAKKGVAFVAVFSHAVDDAKTVADYAKEMKLPFPVLTDDGTAVADKFHVERVPTAVVLDGGRVVRYAGRIDDQYSPGVQRASATTKELASAVESVLAGKDVATPFAAAAGCLLTRDAKPVAKGEPVTYHKHVAGILQANCQTCHRPGEAGPFHLTNFKQAKGWSAMIREVVADGVMPPWHADAPRGHFANDRRLTAADKKALLAWVDQGCPEGDVADAPPPVKYLDGWRLPRKPDLIIAMKKRLDIPASDLGLGVPYQYVEAETAFAEDVWVTGVDVRPEYREVVHHVIVYIMPPGKGLYDIDENILNDGMLGSYVPGDMAKLYPAGVARKLPKGSRLLFEMHYTPNGRAGKDRTVAGLLLSKEKPTHEVHGAALLNTGLRIPAGAASHVVKSEKTFDKPAVLLGMSPHMHLRGKAFKFELISADGKTRQTLLNVPKYDFNWQALYELKEPVAVAAGDKLVCTGVFDNSKANPFNPDPTKEVRWGDQTWQEMMIGFIEYRAKPKE